MKARKETRDGDTTQPYIIEKKPHFIELSTTYIRTHILFSHHSKENIFHVVAAPADRGEEIINRMKTRRHNSTTRA